MDPTPTPLVARYDRDAGRYGHHWAPVLDAAARALVDRVAAEVRMAGDPSVVDVGTGHGVLVAAALERWPQARIVATDASAGMLREARATIERLPGGDRVVFRHAPADALGVPDAAADLVISSFVYQLVPDRAAALAEAYRVLRPGGTLAFVTWLDRGPDYAPAVEFDEAVVDLDIDEGEAPEEPAIAGDFRSARAAAKELRAAGFKTVDARPERLTWAWDADSYLAFKQQYEEDALFALLDEPTAAALVARARERWASLAPDDWTWRAELVSAVARRPR